ASGPEQVPRRGGKGSAVRGDCDYLLCGVEAGELDDRLAWAERVLDGLRPAGSEAAVGSADLTSSRPCVRPGLRVRVVIGARSASAVRGGSFERTPTRTRRAPASSSDRAARPATYAQT